MQYDVTAPILVFRELVSSSWDAICDLDKVDTAGSFMDDWLQSSWERIVEASIQPEMGVSLEVYGEGADCNGASSRVWMPDRQPTHQVIIKYVSNEAQIDPISGLELPADNVFDRFCSLKDSWYSPEPPFTHAISSEEPLVVCPIEMARFFAVPV